MGPDFQDGLPEATLEPSEGLGQQIGNIRREHLFPRGPGE